jgi:hypothetical protein
MPHFDIVFTSAALLLAQQPCRQCGAPMTLISIKPVGQYISQRTFECPLCDRTETGLSSDPLATLELAAKQKPHRP